MTDRFEFGYDGQVLDTVTNEVLDTISRKAVAVDLSEDRIVRQSLTADNVTEANAVLGVTLPAVVLVVNRDPDNALLIGPAVAGPALQRFVYVPPQATITSINFAFFVLDATATLRYKSLVAPVNFYLRAWPI